MCEVNLLMWVLLIVFMFGSCIFLIGWWVVCLIWCSIFFLCGVVNRIVLLLWLV